MMDSVESTILSSDRRQFFFSDQPVYLEGWKNRKLVSGFFSWHPDCSITADADDGGIYIGESYLDGHSGRFVKVVGDTLTTDPCALRPVWYGRVEGQAIVASNLGLAARLSGQKRDKREFEWKTGMNWCPMPGSPLRGFTRLLRDQSLDLSTLEVRHTPRLIEPMSSFESAVTAMSQNLVRQFQQLKGERIILSLTAGLDSRTLLAAMLAAETPFETMTLAASKNSATDVRIAAELSHMLGVKHHVIHAEPGNTAQEDLAVWNRQTLAAASDAIDSVLIPGRFYRFLRRGDVLVRGGCFELGRRFYGKGLGDLNLEHHGAHYIWERMMPNHLLDSTTEAELDAWVNWRRQHPDGLAAVDSFYLDQRIGGWLALEELALDLTLATSVQPANNDAVLSSLVSGTKKESEEGLIQLSCIRQLAPNLLEIPINPPPIDPPRSFARRAYRKMKGLIYKQ